MHFLRREYISGKSLRKMYQLTFGISEQKSDYLSEEVRGIYTVGLFPCEARQMPRQYSAAHLHLLSQFSSLATTASSPLASMVLPSSEHDGLRFACRDARRSNKQKPANTTTGSRAGSHG